MGYVFLESRSKKSSESWRRLSDVTSAEHSLAVKSWIIIPVRHWYLSSIPIYMTEYSQSPISVTIGPQAITTGFNFQFFECIPVHLEILLSSSQLLMKNWACCQIFRHNWLRCINPSYFPGLYSFRFAMFFYTNIQKQFKIFLLW